MQNCCKAPSLEGCLGLRWRQRKGRLTYCSITLADLFPGDIGLGTHVFICVPALPGLTDKETAHGGDSSSRIGF